VKKYLDQLGSQERRWVLGTAVVVFAMLNYLLVWPHFKDWGRNNIRIDAAEKKIATYRAELARKSYYETAIKRLQPEDANNVLSGDPIQIEYFYHARAEENSVMIQANTRPTSHSSDAFFQEEEFGLTLLGKESNLVNFLFSLGSSNSMVRVRAMSLRPDQPRHQLDANITIVASYLKKQQPASPGAKPVAALPGTSAGAPSGQPAIPSKTTAATNKSANLKH
jgi:hypothetical protein